MNVLLVKMSSLGDVVHALPLAHVLAGQGARVSWVVNAAYAGLVARSPAVAEVIPFPREAWVRDCPGFVRRLRAVRYAMAIDVQGLLKSGLVTYASGAPRRIGLRTAREGSRLFYTEVVGSQDPNRHAVERYLDVARALGVEVGPPVFDLGVRARQRRSARPHVVVHPFARWETKRWPRERFTDLMMTLRDGYDLDVTVIGGPGDRDDAALFGAAWSAGVRNRTGETGVSDLVDLLADADLLVTNDSGPMHVAAAVGCPVVALFGPTDPRHTGPWGPEHVVVSHPVPCGPCFRRRCPYHHECLRTVSVEEVVGAVMERLAPRVGAVGAPA